MENDLTILTIIIALLLFYFIEKDSKEENTISIKNINKDNSKEERRSKYFENIEKGKRYEKFISEKFLEEGYQVDRRGETKGRKDLRIDILAKKDDIYFLIQCKNFAPSSIIKQDTLRKFNGDCLNFVINNNLDLEKCRFFIIVPQIESFHNGSIKYFNDNYNKCEYKIVKMD